MHMPGAAADGAIVNPAGAAQLAWQRLTPAGWPLPPEAFPSEAALVGGAVRDALLNRLGPAPDLDLVVAGDAIQLCRQLSRSHGGSAVVLDAERSIARLVIRGWSIDLARQEGGSLLADLQRRDYTINAMALPLAQPGELVDPLGGHRHLAERRLVAVAERNLLEDPLRLLRGLRLAGELGFNLDPRTLSWIEGHHQSIAAVAGERVLAELEKLACTPHGERQLVQCQELGLLQPWQTTPADRAALTACSAAAAEALQLKPSEAKLALPLARLATLLDGESLARLHSSRKLQQRADALRRWQHRLGNSVPARIAEALPEDERLLLHRQLEADLPALLLSWEPATARRWLSRWRNERDPLFHPRPAIDGNSLQRELGLGASPALGRLLQHLMREQAFGRLNGRADALRAAEIWLGSAHHCGERAPRRD